jgi:formyl-CoA transferase
MVMSTCDAAASAPTDQARLPLSGINVLEIGTRITAPLATMMLGDLGADVIKVEPPSGDPFRGGEGTNYGATFTAYNRNKRSIVLDLKTESGRGSLRQLIRKADVLIENLRPQTLKKLQIEHHSLAVLNPRLIHCSITGFGARGPYKDRPAFDSVAQAISGISSLYMSETDPQLVGPTISDNITGMYAAYAVLAAVVERMRTAKGCRLEINMLEASMAFVQDAYTNYTRRGVIPNPTSRVAASQCFALLCGDGQTIVVHLSTPEKFWTALVDAIKLEGLAADQRFMTLQSRIKNYNELQSILSKHFATRTRQEWLDVLTENDVPAAPVLNIKDSLADPQVQFLNSVAEMEHPVQGLVRGINVPVLIDDVRPRATPLPPPGLGEHTDELLRELHSRK